MTTTTCNLTADWNKCPDCQRLKRAVDEAEADTRLASEDLDRAWADYRTDASEGRAFIGTPRHDAWRTRIDELERGLSDAHTRHHDAIDTWACAIGEHHAIYESIRRRDTATASEETEETPTAQSDGENEACTDGTGHTDAETEEMEEVPRADPLIRADKLMGILDREEAAYKVTIGFCDIWDLDASDLHARLATIQTIRTQLERLIDEAKETPNA